MAVKQVNYRSFAGGIYKANVLAELGPGQITVDVVVPGERDPLRLSRVPLAESDDGRCGVCFPAAA